MARGQNASTGRAARSEAGSLPRNIYEGAMGILEQSLAKSYRNKTYSQREDRKSAFKEDFPKFVDTFNTVTPLDNKQALVVFASLKQATQDRYDSNADAGYTAVGGNNVAYVGDNIKYKSNGVERTTKKDSIVDEMWKDNDNVRWVGVRYDHTYTDGSSDGYRKIYVGSNGVAMSEADFRNKTRGLTVTRDKISPETMRLFNKTTDYKAVFYSKSDFD